MKNLAQQNNYRKGIDSAGSEEREQKKIFPEDYEKKDTLDKEIRDKINDEFYALLKKETFDTSDQKTILEYVQNYIRVNKYFFVDNKDQTEFVNNIVNDIFGFGILQQFLADPEVQEIFVEGSKGIFYEKNGERINSNLRFKNENAIRSVISKILAPINRKADESNPNVDARLPDGSRVAITLPPLALNGPTINIRKFKKDKFTLDQYVEFESCSPQMKEFLKWSVKAGLNILIAGGTGSGKTTLLNALSNEIPTDRGLEHIITIEDSAELIMYQPFVSSWETKAKNSEGYGEVDASALVKHALRNAPDRIILGEMRDKVAYDVLQAVNTGHDGTMSTIHCEDSNGAVTRFSDLAASSGIVTASDAKRSFGDSFNLIVFVEKFYDDHLKKHLRKITQITYVAGTGYQGASKLKLNIKPDEADKDKVYLQDLYKYDKIKRKFTCKGFIPVELQNKLKEKGYEYPPQIFEVVR